MPKNFQSELDELLSRIEQQNQNNLSNSSAKKPTLLLHACCGPCSSYVLEYLCRYFDITVLYYNPNIYPSEEYNRRLQELKDFYPKFPPAANVKVIEAPYNPQEFYDAIDIAHNPDLATEPEKGERCRRCYELRLRYSFDYATSHNFDYFCTTLSISPFKDATKLNTIGLQLSDTEKTPLWLVSDFKKKNGFKRSLELSTEYRLYRQDYCGCIYSLQNR